MLERWLESGCLTRTFPEQTVLLVRFKITPTEQNGKGRVRFCYFISSSKCIVYLLNKTRDWKIEQPFVQDYFWVVHWYKTIDQHVNRKLTHVAIRNVFHCKFMFCSFYPPFNFAGNQPLTAKVYSHFDYIHVTEVGNVKSGSLMISVRCTGPYSLQVTGRSTLDFTYQLSSVENREIGESKRLLGSPLKGYGTFNPSKYCQLHTVLKIWRNREKRGNDFRVMLWFIAM